MAGGQGRGGAGLSDGMAAVDGRRAVITVMAGDILPVANRRRKGGAGGVADDRGWLAGHDVLRKCCAVIAFWSSVVSHSRRVQEKAAISCFKHVSSEEQLSGLAVAFVLRNSHIRLKK